MLAKRLIALALLAAAPVVGCGRDVPPPTAAQVTPVRPSQILITIEAIAPRHLAPYGGPHSMPNLGALAATGTVYDDALAASPMARPSLVTLLTGICPDRSGVRDNIHDSLKPDLPTLAEAAQRAGFETAAFVSTPFASYSSGLQRGFEMFDGPEPIVVGPAQHRPPIVDATLLAEHFKQWLGSRAQDKPFFAWIHFADLNGLATPPPGSAGSTVHRSGDPLEDYDKALGVLDGAIGAVLAAAKGDSVGRSSALTVVGTHGVYLGENGRRGDTFWLSDETLRVPLIVVPAISQAPSDKPHHDERATWLPDVAASLSRAIGVGLPSSADGTPLTEVLPAGRARLAWAYAPDDQLAWPPLTAVREASSLSVFTAARAGGLQSIGNISATAFAVASARAATFRSRVLTDALRVKATSAGITLGPGGGEASVPLDADAWVRDLQIARGFVAMPRPGLAAKSAKRLVEAAPDSPAGLLIRLWSLLNTPSDELSKIRDTLLRLYPERSDALHWAAHVELLSKDFKRAAVLLDTAIAVGPVEPEMYYDRACVHALMGEKTQALAVLDTALKAGFRNWDWLDKDPDLASVRTDPGFVATMKAHGR